MNRLYATKPFAACIDLRLCNAAAYTASTKQLAFRCGAKYRFDSGSGLCN
jgi:hypothetical protein